MKYFLVFFVCIFFQICANAQTGASPLPVKYDVVVSFGSMCCGTASDDFLKNYFKKVCYKNKTLVKAWILAGCGREGEFKIVFSLSGLKEIKKAKLKAELKKLIPEQNKKNKAFKASSGPVSIAYDLTAGNTENCSQPPADWKF
jgi:hypothetical protein